MSMLRAHCIHLLIKHWEPRGEPVLSINFQERRKSKWKAKVAPKGNKDSSISETAASPFHTLQHTTGVQLIVKGWFLIPFPIFNCYFSPQKEPQGSERFEGISVNTFYSVTSAWWPAQSPCRQAPCVKGYRECTALLVTWSERPNSKLSLSADCHCQRRQPKAGLVEKQDSDCSSSSPLRYGFLPAKLLSPASVCSDHVRKATVA